MAKNHSILAVHSCVVANRTRRKKGTHLDPLIDIMIAIIRYSSYRSCDSFNCIRLEDLRVQK